MTENKISRNITKTVDEFGRILIPKEIRKALNIETGDSMVYEIDGERLIIKKLVSACIFCGLTDGVSDLFGRPVCTSCLEKMKSM